jgi:hypothetical protein
MRLVGIGTAAVFAASAVLAAPGEHGRVVVPVPSTVPSLFCGARGHPYAAPLLFIEAPANITNANGITPLGNINPGSGHVRPNDHMHVGFPNLANGGADRFPVFAMADGRVVMITEETVASHLAHPDIQLFIRHNASITSYFAHQNEYSDLLQPVTNSVPPSAWQSLGDSRILVFGQHGAPEPPAVLAGQQVTWTRSYIHSWDIGVIDACLPHSFEGDIASRYPNYFELAAIAGITVDPIPFPGSHIVHAQCFLDYMTADLRAQWFPKLSSTPPTCGQVAWDVAGRLRGNWTNPAIDTAPPEALFEVELASISLTPDVFDPLHSLQIGIGSGSLYSLFDPGGHLSQLAEGFHVALDFTAGARVNPDPAVVSPATGTVCYDLPYGGFPLTYNRLDVSMADDRTIRARYDSTPRSAPSCSPGSLPAPDDSWKTFIR